MIPDPDALTGRSLETDRLVDKLRLSRRRLAEVLERVKANPQSTNWWSDGGRDIWIAKTEKQLADVDETIHRYDTASLTRIDSRDA